MLGVDDGTFMCEMFCARKTFSHSVCVNNICIDRVFGQQLLNVYNFTKKKKKPDHEVFEYCLVFKMYQVGRFWPTDCMFDTPVLDCYSQCFVFFLPSC